MGGRTGSSVARASDPRSRGLGVETYAGHPVVGVGSHQTDPLHWQSSGPKFP